MCLVGMRVRLIWRSLLRLPEHLAVSPGSALNPSLGMPSEGIGEGWFYSVLGGGVRLRPLGQRTVDNGQLSQAKGIRKDVGVDNTSSGRMRGDYAVPTLFDGNFDAIAAGTTTSTGLIPGWNAAQSKLVNVYDTTLVPTLQGHFDKLGVDRSQPNYAVKLDAGDSITHNNFATSDWGILRFDLYTGLIASNSSNILTVRLEEVGNPTNSVSQEIELVRAGVPNANGDIIPTPGSYAADRWRIGYGETGFEAFSIDVPDALRGKMTTLRFDLTGGEVYIDNVYFKSQHLLFGNPTNARTPDSPVSNLYHNNYLLEKPQYSVSFSADDHIPNWSAWQLNNSWLGSESAPRSFQRDPKLNSIGMISAKGSDYNPPQATIDPGPTNSNGEYYKFEPGHLAAYSDRKRSIKDNIATNLTINIVPQQSEHNSPLWSGLEDFSRKLVTQKSKEVYVYAGGVGEKDASVDKANIFINGDPTYGSYGVHVPDHLWKVLLILDRPGLGIQEVDANNAQAFAVWTENKLPELSPSGSRPIYRRWNDGGMQIITVAELERRLNADPSNSARGVRYDFFSTLAEPLKNVLKTTPITIPGGANPVSGFLLAEIEAPQFDSNTSTVYAAIRHDSSAENTISKSIGSNIPLGIEEVGIGQVSSYHSDVLDPRFSQVSIGQVSAVQVGMSEISTSQISTLHIGVSQASLPKLSPSQISSTQIALSHEDFVNGGVAQINFAQIDTRQLLGSFDGQAREVSFSSSITLQQLFNVHASSNSHNFNLQNTTIPTWTEFLTGTTPFNLKIEITDLPTGQLAEANITGFDSSGRPTSGTLTLDTDANGLGWF
jgi:DNA/RNA endonuclease G (NUC1)